LASLNRLENPRLIVPPRVGGYYRGLILVLLLCAIGAWWFLHDDPESRVRDAHEALRSLLLKEAGESPAAALVGARSLQNLFAEETSLTGDAGSFGGQYTPQELAATAMRMRELFSAIDLEFETLEVRLQTPDEAVGEFSATLTATRRSGAGGDPDVREFRRVTSRLRRLDGDWRFFRFEFFAVPVEP